MTSPRRPGRPLRSLTRVGAWLLAVLTAVGVLIFGAGTASAATPPDGQTRVRASAPETITAVGVSEHIAAGQGRGPPVLQGRFVVATGVAAETATGAAGRVRPTVSDQKLGNYVEQLYKHQGRPGVVGDGTTMDALPGEVAAGAGRHIQKSQEIVRGLNKWIARQGPSASESDLQTANSLRDELQSLLGPFGVG